MDFLNSIASFFVGLYESFIKNFDETFIEEDRYVMFLEGLQNTVVLTIFATLVGVIIGVVVAILRVENYQTGKYKILSKLLQAYVAVIRGTPIVVQLSIMFYIFLVSIESAMVVAVIAFGINSGAYVSEIIRAGILAVDPGQSEAGRSLGLSRFATMRYIILPQAIKNILPALCNEFIAILKETSIVGLIPLIDVTKAAQSVQARTLSPYFPLFTTAIIYFLLVMLISALVRKLERRLAKSDRSQKA